MMNLNPMIRIEMTLVQFILVILVANFLADVVSAIIGGIFQ